MIISKPLITVLCAGPFRLRVYEQFCSGLSENGIIIQMKIAVCFSPECGSFLI